MTTQFLVDVQVLGRRVYFSIGDPEKKDESTDKVRMAIGTYHAPSWVTKYMGDIDSMLTKLLGGSNGTEETLHGVREEDHDDRSDGVGFLQPGLRGQGAAGTEGGTSTEAAEAERHVGFAPSSEKR